MTTSSPFMPDVRVEVAFDSGVRTPAASRTWTDVSPYVEFQDQIEIVRGRPNELSTISPSTLSVTLDNTDGRFTPGLASSPYYPNVKLGRPIRVLARLLDGTFDAGVAGWVASNGTLASVGTPVQSGAGALRLTATAGADTTVTHGATTADGIAVGSGGRYYFSAYVQRAAGVTRTANLRALWYDSANTLLADTNVNSFSLTSAGSYVLLEGAADAPAAADHVRVRVEIISAAASQVFYVDEARVDSIRFTGFVDEWPVEWRQGVDANADARVTATSRLARLGEGAELRSIIETEILADSPVAYYPLGEPEGSTHAVEATGSDPIGMYSYYGGGGITFGTGTGPHTDGLPAPQVDPIDPADDQGILLAANFDHTLSVVTIEVFAAFPSSNKGESAQIVTLRDTFSPRDEKYLQVTAASGVNDVVLAGYSEADPLGLLLAPAIVSPFDGRVHHFALTYDPGATPDLNLYYDGALVATSTVPTIGTVSTTMPDFQLFYLGPITVTNGSKPISFAHAAVYDTILPADRIAAHANAGLTGFTDEFAGDRIERYAGYAGYDTSEIDADTGVAPLAHIDTTGATVESLLRVIEATEGGVLFDARDGTLVFRDRDHRYLEPSSFTLDAATQDLEADGLRPVLDRSTIVTAAVARSSDGTIEKTYEDTAAADDYGAHKVDIEVASTDPDQVYQAAASRVARYKEPLPRIGELSPIDALMLSATTRAAVVNADISTRFTVENLPSQAPMTDTDFFVEGITETLGLESWRFQFNASPAAIYTSAWVLGSATQGQLGTTTILAY